MSEPILMALVQLFAIIAASVKHITTDNSKKILESYLDQHLNSGELDEYLKLFDELILFHLPAEGEPNPDEILAKTKGICQRLRNQLTATDRILVFIKFIEYIDELSWVHEQVSAAENPKFVAYLEVFQTSFNLGEEEFREALLFITKPELADHQTSNKLIISSIVTDASHGTKHILRENLAGKLMILYFPSVRLFLCRYLGNEQLFLNGIGIQPYRAFVIDNGSILKNLKIAPVYYADIAGQFLQTSAKVEVEFSAKEIEYRFKNSTNGIHPLSFTARSGELIGVMGGSGVGKSTLLNVLNGNLKPASGAILINGYNLGGDLEKLQGIIGFVPQDDLLIEELTVFQNLFFNARLCFRDFSPRQLEEATQQVLSDIGLSEISHLTVGDPINKFISGGQRKRLNIALELIRKPSVLFADEPTSGLSSMDSEMVMLLLKEQTLGGRLVIVNIHQPSSDIFKLFDKLLIMDKGGFPIYFGNPIDALNYFKTASNYVNPDESECFNCGYVNPELLLQITEARIVNEYGKFTGNRKITPQEWYDRFRKNIQPKLDTGGSVHSIPGSSFRIPGIWKQFRIFAKRNILTKVTNRQYILINLLEAPFLAALLAFLTRYKFGGQYIFSDNMNLVAYLFMSVVVSLFLGMMVSAEEIIKDRKIVKREEFLNLSRFSYLNSKIVFLFGLSAIQSMLYVITGNLILGISDMSVSYWLVLFATTCFANIVGLNISAGLNSVVAIYILIPFILVPQLLLSGTVVAFDNLNPAISNKENVPVIGNVMTSRWAFEALAVEQFSNNPWERKFFTLNKEISRERYTTSYIIPTLKSMLDEVNRNKVMKINQEQNIRLCNILQREITLLEKQANARALVPLNKFTPLLLDDTTAMMIKSHLDSLSILFSARMTRLIQRHDDVYNQLRHAFGDENIYRMQQAYSNQNLSDLVKNVATANKIIVGNEKLIRKYEPVYMDPESRCGNAHFYAPVKQVGGLRMGTLWFNILIIWIMTGFLYLTLWHDTLRKSINFFGQIRFRR